jgi:type VI secretion system protein ImpA
MATSPTIDVSALLAPISESAPAGVNLRLDDSPKSMYFRLKDARSGARAAERRADIEVGTQALAAEWQIILSLAPKALAEASKDLEVVAWYIEGLVRAHGFAGLRDGVQLAQGLVEQYWDTFFSLEDEDGLATRLAPLGGLNGQGGEGTLIQPIRKVAITQAGEPAPFAIYNFDEARALAQVTDAEARARREEAGVVSMERFTAAVNESGGVYYIGLLEDIEECLASLQGLGTALNERGGRAAPSTSDLISLLTTIRDTVANFSADLVKAARAAAAVGVSAPADGRAVPGAAPFAEGPIRGREEALRTLLQVAEYFRKFEPHSPISTSLEELVRRARMPFAELLAELLPDATAWRSVLTSAGIKPPPE